MKLNIYDHKKIVKTYEAETYDLMADKFTVKKKGEAAKVAIRNIRKHGNVILDTDFDTMNAHGMEIAGILNSLKS